MVDESQIRHYMPVHELDELETTDRSPLGHTGIGKHDLFLVSQLSAPATENSNAVMVSKKYSYNSLCSEISNDFVNGIVDVPKIDPIDSRIIVKTKHNTGYTADSVSAYSLAKDILSCFRMTVSRNYSSGKYASNVLSAWHRDPTTGVSSYITSVLLQDGILSAVKYDNESHVLSLWFDGRNFNVITVDLHGLCDVYTAHTPLSVSQKLHPATGESTAELSLNFGNGLQNVNNHLVVKPNLSSGIKVDNAGVGINYADGLIGSTSTNKINVNPVISSGLSVSTVAPKGLRINLGDGLSAGSNKIWVKPNLSTGIKVDGNGVGINYGNGLSVSGNQIGVKWNPSTGIKVDDGGIGINIDVGHGLEVNDGKISVTNFNILSSISFETWSFQTETGATGNITKKVAISTT